MDDHPQIQPPDYHRCLDKVLASPEACHELLRTLSQMTDARARSPWSPWKGEEPPPHGAQVAEIVPAQVRLDALQATYDSYLESEQHVWRRLYDVMGVPPMQQSAVELIENVRRTIQRLNHRIAELEESSTR
ncbi:hypothetical protein [Nocardia sp. NPDC019395]|uniref:hypothetical protein n=1 Tax=Nocardia sp. NPDC019395 TaxID=3154686 RepID=UPI0033F730A4